MQPKELVHYFGRFQVLVLMCRSNGASEKKMVCKLLTVMSLVWDRFFLELWTEIVFGILVVVKIAVVS